MLDQKFLDMLCCPACRGEIQMTGDSALRCPACDFSFPIVEGIPLLFPCDVSENMERLFGRHWDSDERASFYDENVEGVDDVFGEYQNESELSGMERCYDETKLGVVLDAGCGNGRALARLPAHTVKVGVDASLNLLKATKRRERADFLVCCELEHLPFKDAIFDTVISCRVLQHIVDQDVAVGEMSRVARGLGDVIIEVYNRWNLKTLYKVIRMSRLGRILDLPFGLIRKGWSPFGPWGMDYDCYNSWWELSRWLRASGMRITGGSGLGFGYHKYLLHPFYLHALALRIAPRLLQRHYELCFALEKLIGPWVPFRYGMEKIVIRATK